LPALEPLIEPFSEIVIKIIEAAIPLFDVFIPLIVKMSDMFINRMLPAIEPIIPEIVELIEQIGNFAVTAWESLMPSIEELIPVIIELWNELKPIIPVLYEIIAAAIKLASVWLQMLLPAIKSILPILRVIIKPLEDVLGVIADIVDAIADAYNWVKKTMKLEEKNKKTATKNTIYGDDVIRLNDFILTKGGKIIETNPNDTIIGTKNPASLGNNIVINIDTVNGMDPDELAIALQKRLEVMIR
jgi:phage-related protein